MCYVLMTMQIQRTKEERFALITMTYALHIESCINKMSLPQNQN